METALAIFIGLTFYFAVISLVLYLRLRHVTKMHNATQWQYNIVTSSITSRRSPAVVTPGSPMLRHLSNIHCEAKHNSPQVSLYYKGGE